jgi:hypothetical protein
MPGYWISFNARVRGMGRRAGIEGVREYIQVQTLTTFET